MKSVGVFTVAHGRIRLKIRLLPTVADVHREFVSTTGVRMRKGNVVNAFFVPAGAKAKHTGSIVLPLNGRLAELIPHEVTHAVLDKMGGVLCSDDEACATAIGMLSARIVRKIGRKYEVRYG